MKNKVSIIIPCYNQAEYIAESINSALSQTYKNIEIICINDGSTDKSSEIIKSFSEKYTNITFLDEKQNQGIIHARNKGIQASHGEYILPLDGDDIIEPSYVEKAVHILDNKPNIGIVYCKARFFGAKTQYWELAEFNKSDILFDNCIFCSALFRKSDFIKVGMYKENMNSGFEDYDLWLSFIEKGFDVYRIDEILFNYRQHKNNTSIAVNSLYIEKNKAQLIRNHLELYLNDEQFFKRLAFTPSKETQKYKKQFHYTIILLTFSAILNIILFLIFIKLIF